MTSVGRVLLGGGLGIAGWSAVLPSAVAQQPLRIGGSFSNTGTYAQLGQIAHKMLMFQWQDGKKVIVWPEELAPGKARLPGPPGRFR